MAVRSRRLWGPVAVPNSNAWTALYTVPAGRVAVVRGLVVTNANASAVLDVAIAANGVSGQRVNQTLWATAGMAAYSAFALPVEVCLDPADYLEGKLAYQAAAVNIVIFGFGTLLDGAPS